MRNICKKTLPQKSSKVEHIIKGYSSEGILLIIVEISLNALLGVIERLCFVMFWQYFL